MKTLILMRHAKSDWTSGIDSDHARPLNPRGRASALALGDWLRDKSWLPDEVLCSSALRTRETLEGLGLEAPVRFLDVLYHAGPEVMQETLKAAQGDTVLLIGHNPGIAEFARLLLAEAPRHGRFRDYPTGATLIARFPLDTWSALRWGIGEAAAFVVPRELTE